MRRYIIPPKKDDDGDDDYKPRRRYIIPPRRKSDDGRLDDKVPINSKDVKQTYDVKNDKSSTKIKGGAPESPESPVTTGETGETGGLPQISVDDLSTFTTSKSNDSSSRTKLTVKHLTTRHLTDDEGHRVKVDVYDTGVEELPRGDKVVRRRRLKFVLSYGKKTEECVTEEECNNVAKEIAKATNYNITKAEILELIDELRGRYSEEQTFPLLEYVRERYPDRVAEIERDPFSWVLKRTSYIVGYERLKLLTLLAVVTSRLRRVKGMSRLHFLLVGQSGAGKSSTVKAVLDFLGRDVFIDGTRLSQNSLGYVPIDSFDGKVLFIDQIDNMNLNYVREAMTEDRICTLVTTKKTDSEGNERFVTDRICIEGQPVVVSTSVIDKIDVDREQLFNRFLKVYVDPKSNDMDKVVEAILTRKPFEVDPVDRLTFNAWLLTRPNEVSVSPEVVERVKDFVRRLSEYTREPVTRVTETIRNLIVAVAVARGKEVADADDLKFVLDRFELDILFNGLGLTERDVEFLNALPDNGGLKTNDVADANKVSKQYALNVLKELERKGLVEGVKEDGRTFTWYLTDFGKRVKSLLSGKEVVETEDGLAEGSFRPDGRGGTGLSGTDGGGVSGGEGKAEATAVLEKVREKYRVGEDELSDGEREVLDRLVKDGLVQKYGIYYQLTTEGYDYLERASDVREAYDWLKKRGSAPVSEFVDKFGADVLEALKRKDLVTFNVVGDEEYVQAK